MTIILNTTGDKFMNTTKPEFDVISSIASGDGKPKKSKGIGKSKGKGKGKPKGR